VRKTRQQLADSGQRLGFVVIDHIGKITPRQDRAPAVDQLGQISNDLAALAKSEDIAILALSQLNRQVEQREDKRPLMSDLRASGRLEEDADNVLLLYRAAYYLRDPPDNEAAKDVEKELKRVREFKAKEHVLEILVEKARNAVTGTVKLFCDIGFNVVQDLDRREQ
jgi:replicative DNA helicase